MNRYKYNFEKYLTDYKEVDNLNTALFYSEFV